MNETSTKHMKYSIHTGTHTHIPSDENDYVNKLKAEIGCWFIVKCGCVLSWLIYVALHKMEKYSFRLNPKLLGLTD